MNQIVFNWNQHYGQNSEKLNQKHVHVSACCQSTQFIFRCIYVKVYNLTGFHRSSQSSCFPLNRLESLSMYCTMLNFIQINNVAFNNAKLDLVLIYIFHILLFIITNLIFGQLKKINNDKCNNKQTTKFTPIRSNWVRTNDRLFEYVAVDGRNGDKIKWNIQVSNWNNSRLQPAPNHNQNKMHK